MSESNFSVSGKYNTEDSRRYLDKMVDRLMPQLLKSQKRILLEDSQSQMTGAEVAQTLLKKCQIKNVLVCFNSNKQNSYLPGLNWINLSEDIYYSRSVIAAAIAAHEVGHVYQPEPLKKLSSLLRQSPIIYYSPAREFPILIPLFLKGIGQLFSIQIAVLVVPIIGALFACLIMLLGVLIWMGRLWIFLDEIWASLLALHLLEKHKILTRQERKVARKLLWNAALTYLPLLRPAYRHPFF
ncbi:zinc metallopeptidase [Lyngbya sp. PCC 8106]|uniref:zinc metallopeptidase n=1 Tax=Lyngbya sp. (strain PCC 8106) TaxID=313612 RepID=UPI000A0215D9|nr:zinc metallopeptidase [Lyngbya sp. PCC 8106]